jgi:hypothetical protein
MLQLWNNGIHPRALRTPPVPVPTSQPSPDPLKASHFATCYIFLSHQHIWTPHYHHFMAPVSCWPPLSTILLCSIPAPPCFDWTEDSESLTIPQPGTPTPLRYILGLRMDCVQPFGTLQQQIRWWWAPPQIFPSWKIFCSATPSLISLQSFITWWHPAGIGPGRPIVTIPVGVVPVPVASVLKLDWDQDPHLIDLSPALWALGWRPPCWVFLHYIFFNYP